MDDQIQSCAFIIPSIVYVFIRVDHFELKLAYSFQALVEQFLVEYRTNPHEQFLPQLILWHTPVSLKFDRSDDERLPFIDSHYEIDYPFSRSRFKLENGLQARGVLHITERLVCFLHAPMRPLAEALGPSNVSGLETKHLKDLGGTEEF